MTISFLASAMVLLLAALPPSTRPNSDIEFLREFGNRGRVRVVREVLVADVMALMDRQRAELKAEAARPATTRSSQAVRTARYRVMFSRSPDHAEQELLTEYDWASPGAPRATYKTWAAERTTEELVVLIYSVHEAYHLRVFDFSPPPRWWKFPAEPVVIPWGGGGPRFSCASVSGTLKDGTLAVSITLSPHPLKRPRASALDVITYRLKQRGEELEYEWVRDDEAKGQ